MEDEFLSIQALKPTIYKIFNNTKEEINKKTFFGYRYSAKDLKEEKNVKIDILAIRDSDLVVISVVNFTDGYNLRYYLKDIDE